jgi:hypothetical protein
MRLPRLLYKLNTFMRVYILGLLALEVPTRWPWLQRCHRDGSVKVRLKLVAAGDDGRDRRGTVSMPGEISLGKSGLTPDMSVSGS